jgi:hypothetical protein
MINHTCWHGVTLYIRHADGHVVSPSIITSAIHLAIAFRVRECDEGTEAPKTPNRSLYRMQLPHRGTAILRPGSVEGNHSSGIRVTANL